MGRLEGIASCAPKAGEQSLSGSRDKDVSPEADRPGHLRRRPDIGAWGAAAQLNQAGENLGAYRRRDRPWSNDYTLVNSRTSLRVV
jgi:hypothetical protein